MKLHFKRSPDLEDEDIAGAWVGYVGEQVLALIIFEWTAEFQKKSLTRFSVSYNDQDAMLVMFVQYITKAAYAHLRDGGNADDLVINLPEVKYEAA